MTNSLRSNQMLSGLFQVCVYSWLCCQELKLYEGCVSMYDAEVVVMNHLNEVLYYCVCVL
jgi:hypothetical protein